MPEPMGLSAAARLMGLDAKTVHQMLGRLPDHAGDAAAISEFVQDRIMAAWHETHSVRDAALSANCKMDVVRRVLRERLGGRDD